MAGLMMSNYGKQKQCAKDIIKQNVMIEEHLWL